MASAGGAAAAMSDKVLQQMSEVLLGWSQLYVVELMHYTLACMMMLEDFPEAKGTPRTDLVYKVGIQEIITHALIAELFAKMSSLIG